ncbi:hypothetical protein ACPCXF_00710 [Lysinibacillus agricola]
MLVTKALSQDVTHLAFVPLKEEAARRSPTGSFALRESEASATNVLSVRKRSVSNKASSLERKSPSFKDYNIHNDFLDHYMKSPLITHKRGFCV